MEHAVGYQPKPDNRGWFDDECKTALEEKNVAYKKWTDRPTSCKRLEYERLQKIDHKICKNKKGIQTDKCIEKIDENIKEKHFRNAHKEGGSLKGGFKPHENLCKGKNDEIILNEEDQNKWKTYFQDLLKRQHLNVIFPSIIYIQMK